ncbi:major capsid protein [Selenomonadales bacterium OttesenSCG-928-I06]|nr:major capsid protein [Selenomonadales bacterium OttesenSCG-928-I06]
MANMNETITMLGAIERIPQPVVSLRDLFFPKVETFVTEEVEFDYRKGGKKIAPYIVEGFSRGVNVARDGFTKFKYKPPMTGPQRPLTKSEIQGAGFGENVYSTKTPAQRAATIRAKDLVELRDMNIRAEEKMVADFLIGRQVTINGFADDAVTPIVSTIDFPGDGIITLTDTHTWDKATATVTEDLQKAIDAVVASAINPNSIFSVCSPNVTEYLLDNDEFTKFFDYRNIEVGSLAPKFITYQGFSYFGKYRGLEIYTYSGKYEDFDGTMKDYLPNDYFIVGVPGQGTRLYGAITQLEGTEGKGTWRTYEGMYIPKYVCDIAGDTETLKVSSRQIIMPADGNDFYTIKVK